jgi:hypothetical protein
MGGTLDILGGRKPTMTWLTRWRRARQLLVLLVMCVGFSLSVGDVLGHIKQQDVEQSPATNNSATATIQIWRTITLGTYKGVNGYREAFDAATIRIGDSANEILGRPAFPYGKTATDIELVLLSVAELGLDAETASLSDVYKRATQIGLELCPAEVGPQLRLDYRNQPRGEFLHIAMEPVATYNRDLTVLALWNDGASLLLIGSDGRSDFMAPRSWRFVFALPRVKERLEALKRPQMTRSVRPN